MGNLFLVLALHFTLLTILLFINLFFPDGGVEAILRKACLRNIFYKYSSCLSICQQLDNSATSSACDKLKHEKSTLLNFQRILDVSRDTNLYVQDIRHINGTNRNSKLFSPDSPLRWTNWWFWNIFFLQNLPDFNIEIGEMGTDIVKFANFHYSYTFQYILCPGL